jgi:hypothetical protein
MDASRKLNDRTRLIVTSRGVPTKKNIEGGIAIIESRSAKELLPLELETGFRVPRTSKKSVELSRLTATGKDKGGMGEILNQMALILRNDINVGQVLVYTSKVHYRLYKQLGLKGEVLKNINSRDLIIRFTPEEIFALAK